MMIQAKLPEIERFTMKSKSFELEKTVPGAFFFQGLAGGMLGGFLGTAALVLWADHPNPRWVLLFTPFYMITGAAVGAFQVTLLWGAYRITGFQLRAPVRVALTTILVGLGAWFVRYHAEIEYNVEFAIGAGIAWLTALPAALLVGSHVKPWEFFTFGSIAIDGYGNRWRSNSVLATLGTLPLRFLSLFALVYSTITFACKRQDGPNLYEPDVWDRYVFAPDLFEVAVYVIPLIYLLLNTYLTFRSPRKLVLLFIALLINIPVGFGAFIASTITIDPENFSWGEDVLTITNSCIAFLVTWTVFLAARLSVRTKVGLNFKNVLPKRSNEPDHQCLGSRFLEWHERAA